MKYANDNGFQQVRCYVDDGYSGTTFERPGFQELVQDIEAKKVSSVITKDLSRLGRNYLTTGYYIEHYFPSNGVRYIAINDNVDTALNENEFTPFRNILNEWYAKDISKKIRSAYRTKAMSGQFTGPYAPYGYMKDPENKNRLIINEPQAKIVRWIFDSYLGGNSMYKIAKLLRDKKVLTPRAETNRNTNTYNMSCITDFPYVWSVGTIGSILENREYTGSIVCNKHQTKSYKDKKLRKNPVSEWIIVNGTHEGIIDEESFQLVQQIKNQKKRMKKHNRKNIFRGYIYCGDCRKSLSLSVRPDRDTHGTFECGTYKRYCKIPCVSHYIKYETVFDYVKASLKQIMRAFKKDRNKFISNLIEANDISLSLNALYRRKVKSSNRLNEINDVIKQLYESYVFKQISDSVFYMLEKTYEKERTGIMFDIEEIQTEIDVCESFSDRVNEFCNILSDINDVDDLSKETVSALVDRIYVYKDKSNSLHRDIGIHYKHVGIL
jgi:DNA invertase Pin-like site-specific DNA recombinase